MPLILDAGSACAVAPLGPPNFACKAEVMALVGVPSGNCAVPPSGVLTVMVTRADPSSDCRYRSCPLLRRHFPLSRVRKSPRCNMGLERRAASGKCKQDQPCRHTGWESPFL